MRICGFNKTTLLDYPGKVASTIFLGGCNFRCPFCQNSVLVLHPEEQPDYAREDILAFLKKRKGILDGVCISGGEPTLAADLEEFLRQIKDLGYLIKLDTNGTRPDVVKHLAESKLIDKVAVDIKAGPDHYSRLAGVSAPAMDKVRETVDFLLHGQLDYEFRTTVVKELHTEETFGKSDSGSGAQRNIISRHIRTLTESLSLGFESYTLAELQAFQKILKETISLVEIRGID